MWCSGGGKVGEEEKMEQDSSLLLLLSTSFPTLIFSLRNATSSNNDQYELERRGQ